LELRNEGNGVRIYRRKDPTLIKKLYGGIKYICGYDFLVGLIEVTAIAIRTRSTAFVHAEKKIFNLQEGRAISMPLSWDITRERITS